MNVISVNFHFSFGILAVVHKLYLSHVAKKSLQFRYKPGCIRIDFTIEVVEGLFYLCTKNRGAV